MINLHEDFHEVGYIAEDDGFVHICSHETGEPYEITSAEFIEYYEQVSGTRYKMKDEYTQAVP